MTNEEKMAHEYAIENWEHYEEGQSDYDALKQAHLAGQKAGRPKWHKVADGDLPKENKRYLCKIKEFVGSGISYECFDYDTEYSSWKNTCGDVIAWCEIPKYTEE